MAVVLGRPMATSLDLESFAQTIGHDEEREELLLHWQTEDEPPRPFDIIVAGYTVAYRYFQDIHHLEHDNNKSQHDVMVKRIHATIIKNLDLLPSWCRLVNPSTKFDATYGCQWLPAAREGLHSLVHLVLLTLHRPLIFSKSSSRVEALRAGTSILHAQERLFQQSKPHQRDLFTPVYASFDAIILISAISFVFPDENHERQIECVRVVKRGVERLEIVGQSNCMARSAHGVASNLYRRLMHQSSISSSTEVTSSSGLTFPESYTGSPSSAFPILASEAVPPPRPIHDLFYDHVSSPHIPDSGTLDGLHMDPSMADMTNDWNFEGTFSDESFWGFLNELDP